MTRQQEWSVGALKAVQQVKTTKDEAEYRTHCMKLPALVQQSGLMQALAFLQSRKGVGAAFCDDVARVTGVGGDAPGEKLLDRAQQAPLPEYMALTRDVVDVAVWFRRFAQIELPPAGEP